MKNYNPPIFLQSGLMHIVLGFINRAKTQKLKNRVFNHEDGEEFTIETFPADFDKHSKRPIVFFFYGVFGHKNSPYVDSFVNLLEK